MFIFIGFLKMEIQERYSYTFNNFNIFITIIVTQIIMKIKICEDSDTPIIVKIIKAKLVVHIA